MRRGYSLEICRVDDVDWDHEEEVLLDYRSKDVKKGQRMLTYPLARALEMKTEGQPGLRIEDARFRCNLLQKIETSFSMSLTMLDLDATQEQVHIDSYPSLEIPRICHETSRRRLYQAYPSEL
jgi:hypothetical protein